MKGERLGAVALMQAMQLGHALAALERLGVMEALALPCEPGELARRLGLDAALLAVLLDHLSRATTLLRRRGGRYQRTRQWDAGAQFVTTLYGGAFGANAARVATLLRNPSAGAGAVDRAAHAAAFAALPADASAALPAALLLQLGATRVVDLGCGRAALLLRLAQADTQFTGWGVEAHAPACRAARAAIRAAGLAPRVQVVQADARAPLALPPRLLEADPDAIVASQFANELFGHGPQAFVDWLGALGSAWPGRLLLLSDYAGRLGTGLAAPDRLTLVHDHAQALSGQGVPPARRRDWVALYRAAGARLVHALEDSASTRFVHLVVLGGGARKALRSRRAAGTRPA